MDKSVTCDQFLPINRVSSAFEVRHLATGFAEDDDSCRHIPRVQCDFPKSIEPAGRDIAQIQSCRSGSAQSLHLQCKSHEVIQVIVRGLANVVRKSSHEKRTIKMVCCWTRKWELH